MVLATGTYTLDGQDLPEIYIYLRTIIYIMNDFLHTEQSRNSS